MAHRRIGGRDILMLARELKISPDTVELDYIQNWILFGLSQTNASDTLVFKGGTCLKKVYFKDYRFSKDLDFTLVRDISQNVLKKLLNESLTVATDACGIEFYIDKICASSQTIFVKIKWSSIHSRRERKLEMNITVFGKEFLTGKYAKKAIIHEPYNYIEQDYAAKILCYSLEEILAEKIRTLFERKGESGAWPRDLYDVWKLTQMNYSKDVTLEILKEKIRFKEINIDPERLERRRDILKNAWRTSLEKLVPHGKLPEFDYIFSEVLDIVANLRRILND